MWNRRCPPAENLMRAGRTLSPIDRLKEAVKSNVSKSFGGNIILLTVIPGFNSYNLIIIKGRQAHRFNFHRIDGFVLAMLSGGVKVL